MTEAIGPGSVVTCIDISGHFWPGLVTRLVLGGVYRVSGWGHPDGCLCGAPTIAVAGGGYCIRRFVPVGGTVSNGHDTTRLKLVKDDQDQS